MGGAMSDAMEDMFGPPVSKAGIALERCRWERRRAMTQGTMNATRMIRSWVGLYEEAVERRSWEEAAKLALWIRNTSQDMIDVADEMRAEEAGDALVRDLAGKK